MEKEITTMEMIKYKEDGDVTIREEYDAIGWSVFDLETIYRVTVTAFTIADGIISTNYRIANKEGTDYTARAYKNFNNGVTAI